MILSATQVGGLLLVIAIGLPHVGEVDLLAGNGLGGVLGASALIFFAFIGFDEVITLAEETRDPTRTVPRALLLALGLSTTLYVAVAVAAVSVLGAPALAASPRPLADVMGHVLGDRGATVVAAIAVVTTTHTTLLALTAASRCSTGWPGRERCRQPWPSSIGGAAHRSARSSRWRSPPRRSPGSASSA
jgi:APA family basic amino acid/polyamine antiporter